MKAPRKKRASRVGVKVGAVVALAAIILIFRKPDAAFNPQFFAEDGKIFYAQAYEEGIASATITYGGYLHLVPRLVAWLASHLDPLWAPAICAYFTFAAHLALILAIFSSRIRLPYKTGLALAFAVVPHTGEVFLNLTNLQWTLALGMILLAIANDARNTRQQVFDLVCAVVCGLTGPYSVFLIPVFAYRAWARRTWESTILFVTLCAVGSIQAYLLFINRAEFVRQTPIDIPWLLSDMSARIYGTFWAGYNISTISASAFWIVLGLGLTVAFAYFVFSAQHWGYAQRVIAISWFCLALPVGIKFVREAFALAPAVNGDRYFFVPHVLMMWSLVIFISGLTDWKRVIPAAALAIAVIGNINDFVSTPMIDFHWPNYVQPLRERKEVHIPINPPGWSIDLVPQP